VMIDERVFDMPHLAQKYVEYLISHEVCHQWWYNTVGTNGYKETFMDEALVVHLSHRPLDGIEGRNNDLFDIPPELSFLPQIKRENYRYSTFYTTLRNKELLPAVQDLEKYKSPIGVFSAVYDRGGWVVKLIEDRLGPAAFIDFMRRIYAKYYFRIIRVADFQRELEEYTGQKWDKFFKEWLSTAGMSDWAVDGVTPAAPTPNCPPGAPFRAAVILSQRAEISESTTLGFSFDGGQTYPHRVPIRVPRKPTKDDKPKDKDTGQATVGDGADAKQVKCEWVDELHLRVEVDLPGPPDQVMVDPDLVIPDADPVNNRWKVPINYRPRPLYTFLDETNFTNDYDKWNVIYGPFFYGAPYAEAWFTRSNLLGLRAGLFRTEEFRGAVYAAYRPTFGDMAVGFDALLPHFPEPKWELGVHGEVSIAPFIEKNNYDPDRFVVWLRHNLEATSSLYLFPREYAETYAAFQRNWMPDSRHPEFGSVGVDPLTTVGAHYRRDTRVPYWDPQTGYYLDGTVAVGIPLFGADRWTGMAWGQASYTMGLPGELGWWSDVKLAVRAGGAVGLPEKARLFTMGGGDWFRGFDAYERQGSCMWLGSVEVRIPVKRDIDFTALDRLLRLRTVTLAPFYDVGDTYVAGHSLGPVAHAVGVGLRLDVDFFSFLERATIRFDVGKAIGLDTGYQFWFGVTQPF
jgi:hypothetical protein